MGPVKENARAENGREEKQRMESNLEQVPEANHATPRKQPEPLFEEMERYREAGFQLIPLHHWTAKDSKGRLRGKTPKDGRWTSCEYSNDDVLEEAKRSKLNVGVRLSNDVVVLDVDPRNFEDGRDSLADIVAELGIDLSLAPHTITGSGGHHYWFRKPINVTVRNTLDKYPGIEFKSAGRQVVAAGSVHPCGKHYRWDGASPSLINMPELPGSVLEAIKRSVHTYSIQEPGELTPQQLESALDFLDPATFSDYEDWLELAMACHHATNGAGRQEFIDWSIQDPEYAEDSWEIGNKWDSFHADAKPGKRQLTVRTLYQLVQEADGLIPHPRPEDEFEPWVEDASPEPKTKRWNFLSIDELEALKPPQWLIPEILVESSLAMVYGAPESGKSFLAIDMAMSIAGGIAWHDRPVPQGGVLYIAAEGAPGLGKRMRAWKANQELEDHPFSLWLMRDGINFASQKEPEINAFIEAANALPISLRLIVIDTLNQTAEGADENSSQDMSRYITSMKKLRDKTGATVMVIHHSGKDERKGPRGSTALLGAMDTTVEVTRSDKNSIEIEVKKQKDSERASPIRFNLEKTGESLVLKPTMISDFQANFKAKNNEIVELALQMASSHSGHFPLKELVDALLSTGKSESTVRREIKKVIGETNETAAIASNGARIWLKRMGANSKGELEVYTDLTFTNE